MGLILRDMKRLGFDFCGFALVVGMLIPSALSSQAGTIIWTNNNGGNWSGAGNWFPNSVPSTNDDVLITNRGIYDVSLNISPTINTLTLGGTFGTQTLHTGTSVLTVSNASVVNSNGVFDLEGGSFFGPGSLAVSGSFVWSGGSVGGGGAGATVFVASNGLMLLEGQSYNLYGILTNAGTMDMAGGSLLLLGACYNNNGMLINLSNAVLNFQGDANIQGLCGTEVVTNFGTVLKSGGEVTSAIDAPFYNYGILDVESGTVSLASTYSLTNGTVNFGIDSLTDFGVLQLAGDPAQLSGALTATLGADYQPIATNTFPVVTYASASGGFTSTNLPYLDAWATNYSESAFSLIVLNARPFLAAISNQTVNELVTLSLTAIATDADLPPQILTFGLSNAPAGMVINPTNGVLIWTPAPNESPSTNVVTVTVTDNGTPPLSSNSTFTVVVFAPTLAPITNYTLNAGQTLTFTNAAVDNDTNSILTFGLASGPASAKIGSTNGVFFWRVGAADAGTTNIITVRVTDNSVPPISVSESFTVFVNKFSSPLTLGAARFSGGQFQIQMGGPVGPDYIIETATVLSGDHWTKLETITPSTTPFLFIDTNSVLPARFYRVQLSP
jgi:hypothetical protein